MYTCMMSKKAQGALESLSTYAWAFLIIMVAVSGLVYFDVFSFQNFLSDGCILDGGLTCVGEFAVSGNLLSVLTLRIKNDNQNMITILNATIAEKNVKGLIDIDKKCSLIVWNKFPNTDNKISIRSRQSKDVEFSVDFIGDYEPKKVYIDGIEQTILIPKEDGFYPEECGIVSQIGQKRKFYVEITYKIEGTNIIKKSGGEVTTRIRDETFQGICMEGLKTDPHSNICDANINDLVDYTITSSDIVTCYWCDTNCGEIKEQDYLYACESGWTENTIPNCEIEMCYRCVWHPTGSYYGTQITPVDASGNCPTGYSSDWKNDPILNDCRDKICYGYPR